MLNVYLVQVALLFNCTNSVLRSGCRFSPGNNSIDQQPWKLFLMLLSLALMSDS